MYTAIKNSTQYAHWVDATNQENSVRLLEVTYNQLEDGRDPQTKAKSVIITPNLKYSMYVPGVEVAYNSIPLATLVDSQNVASTLQTIVRQ